MTSQGPMMLVPSLHSPQTNPFESNKFHISNWGIQKVTRVCFDDLHWSTLFPSFFQTFNAKLIKKISWFSYTLPLVGEISNRSTKEEVPVWLSQSTPPLVQESFFDHVKVNHQLLLMDNTQLGVKVFDWHHELFLGIFSHWFERPPNVFY